MGLKWTREVTNLLIYLLRHKPCLWDVNISHYTKKDKREKAIESIAAEVAKVEPKVTPSDVRSKIHCLRTQYRKEYKLIEQSKRYAAASGKKDEIRESALWCYDQLDFWLPAMKRTKFRSSPSDVQPTTKCVKYVSSTQLPSCWTYFNRSTTEDTATCALCKLTLPSNKKAIALMLHLYNRHKIDTTNTYDPNTSILGGRNEVKPLDGGLKHNEKISTANSTFDPLEIVKNEDGIEINDYCIDAASDQDEEMSETTVSEFQTETFEEFPIEDPSQNDVNNIESANTDCHDAETASRSSQDNLEESHHELEKLKAETRYYNEMADLAQAKRLMIELQSIKLKQELAEMRHS